jgi:predicted GNAT superfamily acetyltransferase
MKNQGGAFYIRHATSELVFEIAELARSMDYACLSDEQRAKFGFLFSYTEREYSNFITNAEWFYVLQFNNVVAGFLLAHSNKEFAKNEMEVYARIRLLADSQSVIVRQICVGMPYSEMGFGRALYNRFFDDVKNDACPYKCGYTFIWTVPPNIGSATFHRKTGWSEIERYTLEKLLPGGRTEVGIWMRKLDCL